MAPRYLLDTNICIYIQRERPARVRAHLEKQKPGSVGLSLITWGELLYGAARSQHPRKTRRNLDVLIAMIPVLVLPEEAGEHYGDIRATLADAGTPIGANDLWIAAHARAADLTVVTNNIREFERVDGLKLENWTQ
ncbi:type II toxin-antitoxin system tRNA(fMet)-specific endonuclease VapC [Salinisphaera sp. SWV1]|uniref:type II toxin-antitoxin system tRNA(fMet)-specific endonuclease VapC n=1 Tax=Salinisphaera sp. SWV1 TaxID=3454139 RepID=UPI003F8308B1